MFIGNGHPCIAGPVPTKGSNDFAMWEDWMGTSIGTTAGLTPWVNTATGTGTAVVTTGVEGGAALLTTGTSANDLEMLKFAGEPFRFRNGLNLHFGALIRSTRAANGAFAVGLTANSVSDEVGSTHVTGASFRVTAAGGIVRYAVGTGSASTTASTGVTFANDTDLELALISRGREWIDMFVNGTRIVRVSSNIPANTVYLTPYIQVKAPGAAAENLTSKWIGCAAINRNAA